MSDIIYQIFISLLMFLSVMAIGASVIIAKREKKLRMEVRLQDDRVIGIPEQPKSKFDLIKVIAQIGNFLSHGNTTKTLNEQLLRAGYISSSAPAVYTGIKAVLFIAGFILMVLLLAPSDIKFSMKITLSMAGSALFFFLPNVAVWRQLKKHRDEIKLHLPEAIDLLEICVTSGIGLDMAWNIVADEMYNVSPILSNAMSLTNFEINLGATRVRAMKNMAERTGVEELSSLAAILIQTERFGTSIADTLRSFANTMREDRSYTAEESAEKLPVKLIIPMALFIFPAVLITLGGPAIIMISKTLLGE